jgi:predicted porin
VTTTQFFDRQSTVRLAGPMGEFRMGRDWVPSFMSYAAADIMGYVGVGVAGNLISATGMEAIKRAFGTFTPTTSRSNNSIEYLTPASLGNLYGHAMIAFSEDSNSAGNFKLKGGRMGYRASGWDVSAHYTGTQIQATGATWSQSGLTALWTMRGTGIRVNGALLDTKYLSSKQSNLMLGAGFPVGVQEFKVTYGRANQSGTNAAGASIDANDAQLYGVSYVYNLSKRSALYANAARVQNKGAATYTIAGGSAGAAPGTAHRGFELGMRHAF